MKYAWWIVVAGLASAGAGCGGGLRTAPVPARSAPAFLRVQLAPGGSVRRVTLEDYVRVASVSEFAPAGGDPAVVERMLEVQAVIARTYAVSHLSRHGAEGFDLCSTTHCQLYQPGRLASSKWAPAAATATSHTRGIVLWFDTAPARTLFHADCGGHTSAAVDVWGGTASPYLNAVADDGPAAAAHQPWRFEVETEALRRALNEDQRTGVGARLTEIVVARRDSGGRAGLVLLKGARDPLVRGEEFRTIVTRAFGARSVRSTLFAVTRENTKFVFTGRGFGHGAGLCQAGALARLRAGAKPEQVLERYYPGTRLVVLR
jgi:stage II sporulation protein D